MRRRVPRSFALVETPLPLPDGAPAPAGVAGWWQAVREQARARESELAEARAAGTQLQEKIRGEQRRQMLALIENCMDDLDRMGAESESRIQQAPPEVAVWMKRVAHVRRRLEQWLEQQQVVSLGLRSAAVGLTTIAETVPRDEVEEGTIVEWILRGWLWRGELLRKAVVVIAQKPGEPGQPGGPAATPPEGDSHA
jgi:molecular chaperone GrpE (heat shock protein)